MKVARRTLRRAAVFAVLLAAGAPSPPSAHVAVDAQIRTLDVRIAAHPSAAALRLQRGELHRAHADWRAAETDYRAALRLDPTMVAADLALGRMLLEAGRPAAALEAIDRFLIARPDEPLALVVRGRALLALGRALDAAAAFSRAIARTPAARPPDPDVYLERARALTAAGPGHLTEALGGLDAGLALLGPVAALQLAAIDLEVERHDYDAALRRLASLESLSARRAPWQVRRSAILEAAGRSGEARAACDTALQALAGLQADGRGTTLKADLADECRARLRRLGAARGEPGGAAAVPGAGD